MNAFSALAATRPALAQLAEVNQNKVTPGLLGFVVFAALGTAVWFLLKSMNKQLKKVDFEVEPDPGKRGRAGATRKPVETGEARETGGARESGETGEAAAADSAADTRA